MGIEVGSNFDVKTGLPLDSRLIVADLTARDAIDALIRYEGMAVYVESEEKNYQLVGGITNGDWQEFGSQTNESVEVDTATTGANASLTTDADIVKLENSSLISIDDIVKGGANVDGMNITLINTTGDSIVLTNNAGAGGILTGTGDDLEVPDAGAILLKYEASSDRWYVCGGPGGGGSGGGGSLISVAALSNPPIDGEENGRKVDFFMPGEGQRKTISYTVPQGYQAGNQINLHLPFYCPDTSGDVRFEAVTTLIKNGEAVTGTTNQHTSTNSAEDLSSSALANKRITQVMDLTDADGEINSVAVAAGDELYIVVTEDGSNNASDIRAMFLGAFITLE